MLMVIFQQKWKICLHKTEKFLEWGRLSVQEQLGSNLQIVINILIFVHGNRCSSCSVIVPMLTMSTISLYDYNTVYKFRKFFMNVICIFHINVIFTNSLQSIFHFFFNSSLQYISPQPRIHPRMIHHIVHHGSLVFFNLEHFLSQH